jgi:hypothetical protein
VIEWLVERQRVIEATLRAIQVMSEAREKAKAKAKPR